MRKTKIICTLGPASNREDILEEMILAGMNVARLNFSHGTHESHEEAIKLYRKVRDNLGFPGAVMLDTKGPEVRLGNFKENKVLLKRGSFFTLTPDSVEGTDEKCAITYKSLSKIVKKNMKILIDDGLVSMVVSAIDGKDVICKVTEGGPVSNHKGVNIPGTHLDVPYLSSCDKEDLLFGIKMDVDYVAASFVRNKDDVLSLRKFLHQNGANKIKIISKIENMEGVDNFDEILDASDGIMIARGDMGVEIDFEKLPGIQKEFIEKCNIAGKVVVTATQMLESMTASPRPTRAEITDIANAVFDGTSAVMLSGESAAGKYPVKAVKAMSKIAMQAERDAFKVGAYNHIDFDVAGNETTNAIGRAACNAAKDLNAKVLLAITESGHTAQRVSKFRPMAPIVASTPSLKTYHQQSLSWGVYPVLAAKEESLFPLLNTAILQIKDLNLVKEGDKVVVAAGLPLQIAGNTNLLYVKTVS